jgi:hypothetical protein
MTEMVYYDDRTWERTLGEVSVVRAFRGE